jgi:hypothetical protein
MATPATLITLGTKTMRPELRFALRQAQERLPSHDDQCVMTEHVMALAAASTRGSPRLVILSPKGAINREDRPRQDRLGSSTHNRTNP